MPSARTIITGVAIAALAMLIVNNVGVLRGVFNPAAPKF
jgi:hypothetical protein